MSSATPMAGERWRLLPYHIGPSDLHFALSDALARLPSVPTVWWHSTDAPTLILGAGQSVLDVDAEACRRAGVTVIKRHAGGSSVFAEKGVLGLDIALPSDHPLVLADIVGAYAWIGEVWNTALHELGVKSHVLSVESARAAEPPPRYADIVRMACFGALSPYEVLIGTRKLVGLAQVRRAGRALFQSGIHFCFDAHTLATLLPVGDKAAVEALLLQAATGLDRVDAPRHITEEKVMAAVSRAISVRASAYLKEGEWTPKELSHAQSVRSRLTVSIPGE